jgi:hypothetical protein
MTVNALPGTLHSSRDYNYVVAMSNCRVTLAADMMQVFTRAQLPAQRGR